MESFERRAEKFEKQYDLLLKERNSRVAVEDEIDEHFVRLEHHEEKTAAELHRLQRSFQELIENVHKDVVDEVAHELADFRQTAIGPIEAELRAALKTELNPIQRQVDRCEADQANFEKSIERVHNERFVRIEKAVWQSQHPCCHVSRLTLDTMPALL